MEAAREFTGKALSGLQEIALPPPVPYVPHTVGWLIVGVLLALLAAFVLWRIFRHHRANAYRREALAELAEIERELLHSRTETKYTCASLPSLLKRTAIAAGSRTQVASLTGDEWLRFLDRSFKGNAFQTGPGRLLPRLAYAQLLPSDISRAQLQSLLELSRRWIRHHDAHI